MTGSLAELTRMRCRVVRAALGEGPSPGDVLRAAAGSRRLVCLHGDWAGGSAVISSDPILVLATDGDLADALASHPAVDGADPDVVAGGWFGWLPYDGASYLGYYDHVLRYVGGQWFFEALWSEPRDAALAALRDEAEALLASAPSAGRWAVGEFAGPVSDKHLSAVERAVESIRAGDIYQVNVCTRLEAGFTGSAASLFATAAERLQPHLGAYVAGDGVTVASFSPELFLRRRGREVQTAPIKGTWPGTAEEGRAALRRSAKDTAENIMITDLMRNDLGRVAETGSVRVSSLLDVVPHPGVWHLVSTVSGRLRRDVTDGELITATFPPGSVTGAPKLRAVEIIADLETTGRGVYTGAIGFASPSYGLEFNVAIRTFEIRGGRIELGVGGGVTADSVPMLEWQECLHKAAPLLGAIRARVDRRLSRPPLLAARDQLAGGLLETVLAIDGRPLRLADHLARLDRSSRELYGRPVPAGLRAEALRTARQVRRGRSGLRVMLAPGGELTVSCAPVPEPPTSTGAHVVHGRMGLWRHKWADRRALAPAEEGVTVPLFVADDMTVLETSRGNVFMFGADGGLVTPPLRDDLLPGITRRAVLDAARDRGCPTQVRPFSLGELLGSGGFWTSSLSGAVIIESVDGTALPRHDARVAELRHVLTTGETTVR